MRTYRTSLEFISDKIPLALFTDKYSLTMSQAYFASGVHEKEAVFHLSFRKFAIPGSGYAIAGGLDYVVEWLRKVEFSADALDYLSLQNSANGEPLYSEAFLALLEGFKFVCDIDAVSEGTVIGCHAPIIRAQGPVWQLQLIEGALLNFINRQTSVMTKAARIISVAGDNPVSDQSLRRAPGIDGSLSDTLACYKAGFTSTSNELAGFLFGIPTAGTMAHSFVMLHESELESFYAYAKAFPYNALFLVDTYDTINGVMNAIEVAKHLKSQGLEAIGIRIDSGDLAYLSKRARELLDEASLSDVKIFGSNSLSEFSIESIKRQGGAIVCWGVGEQIAGTTPISGVWKIGAVRNQDGSWRKLIKIASDMSKATLPGILGLRRYCLPNGKFVADCIYDHEKGLGEIATIYNPTDIFSQKKIPEGTQYTELLEPVFRKGELVAEVASLEEVRSRVKSQLAALSEGTKRLDNAQPYVVGLSPDLFALRTDMIFKQRGMQFPSCI